jgi:hypothetical protein
MREGCLFMTGRRSLAKGSEELDAARGPRTWTRLSVRPPEIRILTRRHAEERYHGLKPQTL